MGDAQRTADFTAYVLPRQQALARLAYLLTGDRDSAEDLPQNALAKVYRHWGAALVRHPRGRRALLPVDELSRPDCGQWAQSCGSARVRSKREWIASGRCGSWTVMSQPASSHTTE
ncbi:hypothetical protein GCM10009740_37590 [Terrabacter terrae]|uniref:RNA polymerase sigma-70 region 2 domain-containing protein n=1 Tax=Terrabacter terrae TaxID=318434 RepID=A0ABN1ZLZ3_9MICO